MKTPAPRIAANDPRLAHALTRHAASEESAAMARRLRASLPPRDALTVPKLQRAVHKTFGPMLVTEYIGRLHGERANAFWVGLAITTAGDMIPMCLDYHHGYLHHTSLRMRVLGHALARLAQRTLGAADMARTARIVGRHILILAPTLPRAERERPEGSPLQRLSTTTSEGSFMWKLEDHGEWVAATWLDPDSAADPTIKVYCDLADEGRGYLRTF